ncbi:MAG TPA: Uma2 family endonuclease [Allocoleopsis sp.]
MTSATLEKEELATESSKIMTLYNISWLQFKTIDLQLENNKSVKLSYLDGIMEIMSPVSRKHEYMKSTLGLLLETYMREKGIRFYRTGGFTLESPGYSSGIPDESYCINSNKEIPDIVIEIIVTSGTIKRTELYKPLRVPEVWFWRNNQINIFQFQTEDYQEVTTSKFFPALDKELLLKYLQYEDQYDAVNDFIQEQK